MKKAYRIFRNTLAVIIIISVPALVWLWDDRPTVSSMNLPTTSSMDSDLSGVNATWLGVSTILFDDGTTQLLIDGFFSRPTALDVIFGRAVSSDAATINYTIEKYGINRLAAIIVAHSHYDHSMDSGAVALRTGAQVIGSESTANVARGADLNESKIVVMDDEGSQQIGQFKVTLLHSRHAPVGNHKAPPFPGNIHQPLRQPQPVSAWKEGGSYSIIIEHPLGNALVQASAGFVPSALRNISVDTVFLGVGGLQKLGAEYANQYWAETVTSTSARRVIVVHFDDFTRPLGEVTLFPRIVDDPTSTIDWLQQSAAADGTVLEIPVFGKPIALF